MKKEKENKVKLEEYTKTYARVFKSYWSLDKWNLMGRLLLATLQVTAGLLAAYYGGKLLGEIVSSIESGGATRGAYELVILQAGIYLLQSGLSSVDSLLSRVIYIKWDKYFTMSMNERMVTLDTDFFEDRDNQKLLHKLNQKGGWALGELAAQLIYAYQNLFKVILVIGVALQISIWVVPLLFIASLPRIYAEVKQSKLQWGIWQVKGDEYHRYYNALSMFKEQKSLLEIRLYGLKKRLLEGVVAKNMDKFHKEQTIAAKSTMRLSFGADTIYEGSYLVMNIFLIRQTISGVFSISNYGFYTSSLLQFNTALNNLTSIIARSGEYALYMKDYFQLIDSRPTISSPVNPQSLEKTKTPTIEFRNVSFAYRSNPKEKILKNLNFTIHPGEHLALVGENGAGKTTIIKLLLRLYDVTEGEILVNGINIKEIDLDSYWRQIGVLFQDFNRYPFDIQTNIELGRVTKKPTKKEIDRAVELSNLAPMLDKLPKGINTILDNSFEEGVEPSGGQWQRVALARAFYRNSNILILDEPTASVDANAEYEIFNNIFAHYGDKTALIISHRFSTVKRAQRIVVLDKGRIIEEGSHRELMKSSKLYAEMFSKQAEGYQD